jgi:hypothetical protein
MEPEVSTTEDRLNAKLKLWDLRQDDFALVANLTGALPGTSRSAAQRALAGKGLGFGAEASLALSELAKDIDEIIAAAHPLPLNLRNPALLASLVRAWREKKLTIVVRIDN